VGEARRVNERLAAHEAGHATAAYLLGRINTLLTLNHPATGGGASVDRMAPEPLNGHRRPLAAWYEAESDCLVVLAGPLSELIDYDAEQPRYSTTPARVEEDEEPVLPDYADPPLRVTWQHAAAAPDCRNARNPTPTRYAG
jgi:hypothetical protein